MHSIQWDPRKRSTDIPCWPENLSRTKCVCKRTAWMIVSRQAEISFLEDIHLSSILRRRSRRWRTQFRGKSHHLLPRGLFLPPLLRVTQEILTPLLPGWVRCHSRNSRLLLALFPIRSYWRKRPGVPTPLRQSPHQQLLDYRSTKCCSTQCHISNKS